MKEISKELLQNPNPASCRQATIVVADACTLLWGRNSMARTLGPIGCQDAMSGLATSHNQKIVWVSCRWIYCSRSSSWANSEYPRFSPSCLHPRLRCLEGHSFAVAWQNCWIFGMLWSQCESCGIQSDNGVRNFRTPSCIMSKIQSWRSRYTHEHTTQSKDVRKRTKRELNYVL